MTAAPKVPQIDYGPACTPGGANVSCLPMKQTRDAWGTFSALVFGMLAACSSPASTTSSNPGEEPATPNDIPTQPGSTTTPASASDAGATATDSGAPATDSGTPSSPTDSGTSSSPPPTPAPTPPPGGALDLGATDSIDDLGFDFAKAHADGLTRTTFYTAWKDLEPSDGVYKLADIDDMVKRTTAGGLKLSLEIEITNTDCVDYGMTDSFCVASKFPSDLPYSRTGAGFADPNIARRLAGLVSAITAKYDSSVLTHVFVGNEVDRYIQVVLHDNKIDLSTGFANMLGAVRSKVAAAHPKRPSIGTAVEFQPRSDYLTVPPKVCPQVDVVGLTIYPTEPDAEGTDAPPAKVQRWMASARTMIPGACRLSINEVGANAVSPYGTPDSQNALAASIVTWLKANRGIYDYATWFAMNDNPDLTDLFGGFGLRTRAGVARPAYTTWLSAGK